MSSVNADPAEVQKFSDLAHHWWDPDSEFKPLHEINPLRLGWINSVENLAGKNILDVGCGGGILSESMAACGARVTGIDLSEKALGVARLHLLESGRKVDYRLESVEAFAANHPAQFDVVTCMEMLEHVPDPASAIAACAQAVKPGGHVFLSTINRNAKAYLFMIVGAEVVLKLLPRKTHDYSKFIKPSELARHCRAAGLEIVNFTGLTYNPITKTYALGNDTDVNYMAVARKPAA